MVYGKKKITCSGTILFTAERPEENETMSYSIFLSSNSYSSWACVNKIVNRHVELSSFLNGVLSHSCFHSFILSLIHTKHVYEITSPKEARTCLFRSTVIPINSF